MLVTLTSLDKEQGLGNESNASVKENHGIWSGAALGADFFHSSATTYDHSFLSSQTKLELEPTSSVGLSSVPRQRLETELRLVPFKYHCVSYIGACRHVAASLTQPRHHGTLLPKVS